MSCEQDTPEDSGYQSQLRDGDGRDFDGDVPIRSTDNTFEVTGSDSINPQVNNEQVFDPMVTEKSPCTDSMEMRDSYDEAQLTVPAERLTSYPPSNGSELPPNHSAGSVQSDDSEIEILERRSGSVASAHRVRENIKRDFENNLDHATNEQESYDESIVENDDAISCSESTTHSIKLENHNHNALHATPDRQMTEAQPMSTFHGLPEVGTTDIPRVTESDLHGNSSVLPDDITSDMMATEMQKAGYFYHRPEIAPEEIDSEEEDRRAKIEFIKAKSKYEERDRLTGLTFEEQLEFAQITKKEQKRIASREKRKLHEHDEAARAHEQQSLFIPDGPDSPVAAFPASERSASESNGEENLPSVQPERGRTKEGKTKRTASKPSTKSKVTKKQPSKAKGLKRGRKKNHPGFDPTKLLHNDVVAAAAANQNKAAQPGFTAKNKKTALAQLIDSIPLEERDQYVGEKVDLEKATRTFNGRGAMKSDGNGKWLLRGMKSSLHHYQLLGVSWMRKREAEKNHPRGGILSDEMGFGKTVAALANMVDGVPNSQERGARATLVIVPATLVNQWLAEIDKHVAIFKQVMVYTSKWKVLNPASVLSQQDVVIASYHEVIRSLPRNKPPPHLYTAQAKEEWWQKEVESHKGPLHQIRWHRLVLDEAQAIKNHLSMTSQAVCLLQGKYRWCLSGTPIQNSLEEFYPYFKFLRCKNTGSFDLFKRNFTKRGSEKALQRLQTYLSGIMLRRTHSDTMFGLPIVPLPNIKPVETIVVKFNPVERAIYNIVRRRFMAKVKILMHGGNAQSNYQYIFVLLLRLRQLVGHPILIQKTIKELLEGDDFERLWTITKMREVDQDEGSITHDEYQHIVETLRATLAFSGNAGANVDLSGFTAPPQPDNKLSKAFRRYLEACRRDGNWAQANARSICVACSGPPVNPHITPCLHLYCFTCLNDMRFAEIMDNKEYATCMECNAQIKTCEAYAATAFNNAGARNGVINNRQTPDEDDIDWFNLSGPILRSSKIKGAVSKIKEWFEQNPESKIIVFTQFRNIIRVMEKVCKEEKWGCAMYHGAMPFEQRDQEINRFSDVPECKILLAAMKAGGVGLNLTAANRVIVLDLWWNISVESQAFTRCYRIGQQRDVEVARFVVEHSIDTDIQRMQERKIAEIQPAMDSKQRPHPSLPELIDLFSDGSDRTKQVDEGEDTQVISDEDEYFIIPDDPYEIVDEDSDKDVSMTGLI